MDSNVIADLDPWDNLYYLGWIWTLRLITWIHPGCLLEQSQWSKHARKHSGFCPWLPGPINCNLDGFVVGGNEHGMRVDCDGHGEALASSGPAHEPQVAKLCHLEKWTRFWKSLWWMWWWFDPDLVLHDGCMIPKLSAIILIVSGADRNQSAIWYVLEGENFECHGEGFVWAPVVWQRRAKDARWPFREKNYISKFRIHIIDCNWTLLI